AAQAGAVQAAGHCRDHRLGRSLDTARSCLARSQGNRRYDRCAAEIPGRHCQDARQRGSASSRSSKGGDRLRRPPSMSETNGSDAPSSSGRLVENLMFFGRTLRAAGMPIGPGRVIEALRAVEAVGVGWREDFYWTLHSVFVNCQDQRPIFDQAFHVFWRNPKLLERMMAMLLPTLTAGEPDKGEELSRRLAE